METVREQWTDVRLDDLNRKVDEGFRRLEDRFAALDDKFDRKFDALHRSLTWSYAALAVALISAFVAHL